MLVFMTYNVCFRFLFSQIAVPSYKPRLFQAYLILSVVLGAAIGHYIFNPTMDVEAILAGGNAAGKGMACH